MRDEFTIKDSGQRTEFAGGMVRDTTEGKIDYSNVHYGPMLQRWAAHTTKGREKYPDPEPGIPNWTLGRGIEVWLRAQESLERHFKAWIGGKVDEDHAAAMFFNINLKEYVEELLTEDELVLARRIRFHRGEASEDGPEDTPELGLAARRYPDFESWSRATGGSCCGGGCGERFVSDESIKAGSLWCPHCGVVLERSEESPTWGCRTHGPIISVEDVR